MKLQRFDRAMVLDYQEDAAGFLTVRAGITRPGVFPYRRGDGGIQFEAKLPEDILSDAVVQSARAKPVTDEHPPEPVTLDNIQKYSRGMSHTDSRVEDDKIVVTMTVTDRSLIERVRSGKQKEISIGFETDLIQEPGEYMGQRYDAKQTNIAINHIAIVARGRAGPHVAIRGDSAFEIDEEDINEGGQTMAMYTIDGKEFEVPSEVKSKLDVLEARLDAANTKVGEYDKLQGRYDALEAERDTLKGDLENAKKQVLTADKLDAAIAARVALIDGARKFLGDSFDFSGKTDRDVKVAVIQKVKGADFKADGKSDEYIDAFYDASVERARTDGFTSTGANSVITGSYTSDTQDEIAKAKSARLNVKDHWKEGK
ncbi:hypothetical protein PM3016_5445 [Paenibacillus mucilaginosus 3016]|uniref:DUF2213 domain-containing protein n=1 Tax=Paenibacillus mucilaginosus 3016 TaxID=1116391 RepID=H6NDU6_9BACL|nr:DUF2213 domain-containing protein [Paenibacillus mucilaginosus]AFC32145.1 hypothetical protein PM3016_5445 [Paenibacillus mucilaginosus 3016]WFA20647.1 DUF2213 domain-containing protein [Paenibacillus mucilaginosus]